MFVQQEASPGAGGLKPNGALKLALHASNDRAFPLDGNPCFDLLSDFDRQHSPEHDEGSAVFFIIDGFAFEFSARFQRHGKPLDNFFIGTHALKNPG